MARTTTSWLALLLLVGAATALTRVRRQDDGAEADDQSIDELCDQRPPDEYFRLSTDGDCRDVVRCTKSGIKQISCPSGLAFDVEKQTCDWKGKVQNCNQLEKPRKVLPILKTDEPVCPEGKLSCGNGECIEKELFCNDKPDCKDESDENACTVETDPNRAPDCDPTQCVLPDCFCSADGTRIPGSIEPNQVPQMITLTFNGAVNVDNIDLYEEVFNGQRNNPNGCQIRGTFFVSHKYTNYSAVQDLHRRGHEIGVFSLTHKDDPNYWTQGSYDDWLAEMAGARLIVERFANITDGSIIGMRAPYLRVGGNKQFEMMADQFFVYDASITAPLGRVPIWPYTLYFRMPHKCNGNAHNCPSRSHPVWEMVMNELDRRDDPTFDESLPGCHMVDSCSNIQTGEQFARLLRHNFNRHFNSNRAPLGLHFHASWLKSKKEFKDELIKFIQEMLERNDVYFVTMLQVIQWMQNPTELTGLRDFQEWKEKCDVKGQPYCSLPNACPLTTRELPGETLRLFTCMECPNNYPWILDPTGDGFSVKK
ncbi:chitin deacetylase 1 isoform X2 [Schistocerca americana]|uniref:chitin deacetylase 1 isoform X2 n=1 Tax=Schistocerca americana TaxID=7009 RepID=UPI001F500C8B|nr:chitin deacetylase 1 isoform X2 [Schistocerca americana]XP_047107726.1 chitin deacetylase 1 isoform X2 [Schistocerca piceifrons]XP_049951636.1 chitin deacetylase 1 isoform X2 [Schistocerca serialis cubense]